MLFSYNYAIIICSLTYILGIQNILANPCITKTFKECEVSSKTSNISQVFYEVAYQMISARYFMSICYFTTSPIGILLVCEQDRPELQY